MYFQFLIEDRSGAELIHAVMKKVTASYPHVTYDCKGFHGIGGFTKKNTVKETKTGKLLNDLATYLRGFNRSLRSFPSAIVVVLDNDDRDTDAFQRELEAVAEQNRITVDHVFCIAVEEVEAWLLGDEAAVCSAYPQAKTQFLRAYRQDSICGTWEVLADVVYPGGRQKLQKDCPSNLEVGGLKIEWAQKIGLHMDLDANRSPSFHRFLSEITSRAIS